MVGRRGEAPLVPPYKLRRPNKAMALDNQPTRLAFCECFLRIPIRQRF